jgi:hypothetical protein
MQYTNELASVEAINVSKKEGNKRVLVGTVQVPVPTLADIGVTDDGSLVAAWVAKAIRASALSDARNKLVSGSATLKAGCKIATTLDELAAPAENSGEALKEIAAFKRAFADYLQTTGISAKAQAFLAGLAASPKAVSLQPPAIAEKLAERLDGYLEATGEQTATVDRYIASLLDVDDTEELNLDDL